MNANARSIIATITALSALILATGMAAAEPRFEPNRSQEDLGQFQINKKEPYVPSAPDVVLDYETMMFLEMNTWDYATGNADTQELPDADAVLDFATMQFLEINTWYYHTGMAGFLQADIDEVITAYVSVCQGEGLVSDSVVREGLSGMINTYCRLRGGFQGDVDDDPAPPIPLHPDWPDGGLYDTPEVIEPIPQIPSWPIGVFDY